MTAESGGPKRRLEVRQSGRLVLRQTPLSGGRLWSRSFRAAVKTSARAFVRAAVEAAGRAVVKASNLRQTLRQGSIKAAVWQRTPEKLQVMG